MAVGVAGALMAVLLASDVFRLSLPSGMLLMPAIILIGGVPHARLPCDNATSPT